MTQVNPEMKGYDPAYPPPPPAFSAQPPQYGAGPSNWANTGTHSSTIVVTQPGLMMGPMNGSMYRYGEHPATVICQYCNATVTTGTMYTVGTSTWVICLILWLVGLGLGCCLIPFCMDGCKDVVHSCPNCKATVGRFSRM